jgi:replicative DNA helicase
MVSAALKTINSICKNGDIYLALAEDPKLFGEWADVFINTRDYYTDNRSVPTVSVLKEINPDFEEVVVEGTTDFYLGELKKEYVAGKLREAVLKSGKYLQEGWSPFQITDELQKELASLQRMSTSSKDLDIMDLDLAREYLDKTRKEAEDNGGTVGIATGFKGIDAYYTTGMAPGHVIYAIGFSSHGKTWWAAKMAERAWSQGVKPLVISLEMTPEDMRNRIWTMIGEGLFKNSDLQRGIYDEVAWKDLGEKKAGKTGFVVASGMDDIDVTPNFCQAKFDQHHPGILIFDYQQLGMDNAKSSEMVPRMMNFSREMKLFAKKNNIPVIIISAVTDKSDGRNRPPDLGSLAWGRSLEYTADMIIAVHKHENGLTEFVMRKNRFGELGDMFVETDYNSGIFKEKYDSADDSSLPD